MGAIGVWGEHFGRQRSAPHALFCTALLMTAWDPHTLWDLGFLLSFAATWGLIALADPLQLRFQRLLSWFLPARWVEPVARALDEALVLTTCAQVTTLPIVLYNFRTLSLVTLLSNALILPVQQYVMIWGAAATLSGLLWMPVGRVLAWLAWLPLAWTVWAVEWTADLPRAAVELGRVAPAMLWVWYGLVGGGAWWMAQTEERRRTLWTRCKEALAVRGGLKALLAGMGIVALLVWLAVWAQPDGKLHVTFLDVGQGDAVLVETPSGRQVVLDGGPSGTAMSAHVGQRLPFWDRSLDVVLLTALNREHLDGLVPVLERYAVERLWYPHPGDELPSAAFEAMWSGATSHGAAIETMSAGTRVDLGDGVLITMLYPPGERKDGVSVVRLDYGSTCFLFGGSADLEVEGEMVARGLDLRCDVLQVGQQGSGEASSLRFLEAVRPALAVVSCGTGSYVPEPDVGTLERLAKGGATVARTDELGSVEVVSDGAGYRVKVGK
jgi:competence protein ComEC